MTNVKDKNRETGQYPDKKNSPLPTPSTSLLGSGPKGQPKGQINPKFTFGMLDLGLEHRARER
jgi:hypothetical protein